MYNLPMPSGLIIYAGMFILAFFLCNWLLRRRIPQVKRRQTAAVVAAIVLSAGLYLCMIWALFSLMSPGEAARPFDQARWLSDTTHRFEMTDDVVKTKLLTGKDTAALLQLLGSPDIRRPLQWEYYAGSSHAGFGIAVHYLVLDIAAGRVTTVHRQRVND